MPGLPDAPNATVTSQERLALVRYFILLLQIPLIIIMGFHGQEYGDWNEVGDIVPWYVLPSFVHVRVNTLIAVIVLQCLTIPVILHAMWTMRSVTVLLSALLAFCLTICAIILVVTAHMSGDGRFSIHIKDSDTTRSWFGLVFYILYTVPIECLAVKIQTGNL